MSHLAIIALSILLSITVVLLQENSAHELANYVLNFYSRSLSVLANTLTITIDILMSVQLKFTMPQILLFDGKLIVEEENKSLVATTSNL